MSAIRAASWTVTGCLSITLDREGGEGGLSRSHHRLFDHICPNKSKF